MTRHLHSYLASYHKMWISSEQLASWLGAKSYIYITQVGPRHREEFQEEQQLDISKVNRGMGWKHGKT